MIYFEDRRLRLDFLQQKLKNAAERNISKERSRFIFLTAKLDAMSPFKVLTRGYSLVKNKDGHLVYSSQNLTPGEEITLTFREGSATATVKEVSI